MSSQTIPIISELPQFTANKTSDSLAAANPIYQALLASTGGHLGNVNALAASQPGFAGPLSLFSPGGGINPNQAMQFGPLFGLLMSLMGNGQQPTPGQGL